MYCIYENHKDRKLHKSILNEIPRSWYNQQPMQHQQQLFNIIRSLTHFKTFNNRHTNQSYIKSLFLIEFSRKSIIKINSLYLRNANNPIPIVENTLIIFKPRINLQVLNLSSWNLTMHSLHMPPQKNRWTIFPFHRLYKFHLINKKVVKTTLSQ